MEEITELKKQLEEKEQIIENLQNVLSQQNVANIIKRLDFLFRVAENHKAFSKEFVDSCTSEIMDILTIKKDKE